MLSESTDIVWIMMNPNSTALIYFIIRSEIDSHYVGLGESNVFVGLNGNN